MSVNWNPPSGSVGFVLALIVLIIALVFFLLGRLPWETALLVALLAAARML